MATSGVITSSLTAGEAITAALQDLSIVPIGREANGSQIGIGIRTLNWMLKEWQADGANLWREEDGSFTYPGGQDGPFEMEQNAHDIVDVRAVISGSERLLQRWETARFNTLPNKSTPGTPTIYVVQPTLNSIRLRVWPVPTTDTSMLATFDRVIEDVTGPEDEIDVPQQWASTLIMNLAARLSNAFGQAESNVVIIREAARLYQLMRAADRPASYFMQTLGMDYGAAS